MGSFIHFCKYCNAKLNVDDAWLGKSMKCPACGKKITFPAADGSVVQSVPTINLRDLPNSGKSDTAEFPSVPDFALPTAPENVPQPKPSTASTPRRIKLKPLKGVNETVPSQPNISLPIGSGEIPFPPLDESMPSTPSMPAPPKVMPPPPKDETIFESFSELPGENFVSENDTVVNKAAENNFAAGNNTGTLGSAANIPESYTSTVAADFNADEPESLFKRFFSKNYFWGRLGSASVYVLAGVLVLVGIYFSLHIYWDYRSAEELIPEKHELAKVNKELNAREKSLSEQFKNAIHLLQGSGAVSQDGVLDGLPLAEDICRRPDPMPLGLLSSSELKTAQKILAQYQNSNKKIKEEFIKSFGQLLMLANQSKSSSVSGSLAQIILQAGEVKKKFYVNENAKLSQLDLLDKTVEGIKNAAAGSADSARQEAVKRFMAASSFVRKQLFPAENNITIVKASGTGSAASAAAKTDNSNEAAINLINSLAYGWRLDAEIAGMEMLLEKVPMLTEVYEKKKHAYLRVMGKRLVTLWLEVLLSAFALLVIGDLIRAFLDMADRLRNIEEKK